MITISKHTNHLETKRYCKKFAREKSNPRKRKQKNERTCKKHASRFFEDKVYDHLKDCDKHICFCQKDKWKSNYRN